MAGSGSDAARLSQLDRERLFHPFTSVAEHLQQGPRIFTEAKGVWLRDAEGREVLDAMAGLWCVNAGYGRAEIAEAMARQARRLGYAHAFLSTSNEPAIDLADRLLAMAPPGMSRAFFCNSGSEANETVVKLVWYFNNLRGRPEKKKIIARLGGYHGVTLGAASLTGLPHVHAHFDLPLPGFLHVECPHFARGAEPGESEEAYSSRLADALDARIRAEGPDTVAAFIGEPVMAAGGVIPPPDGYWPAIQRVLREHDVLLIADEVVCGFGRLGSAFGSFHYGIEPDLMTLAKGLTSAYFPVSAVLVSEDFFAGLRDASPDAGPLAHGHTTTAHPVGAAAALANLDLLEREGLVERAAQVGEHLQRRLREALKGHPRVAEVRGVGLIAGVELCADARTREPFAPERAVGRRLHER
ncbi:MAG: aminotransferase, partial [Myxococcota bacterium]|nr:aminotransferase [Myxococcota bacterium]